MISCACGPGRAVLISGRLGGAMVLVAITLLLALKRKLIDLRFQICALKSQSREQGQGRARLPREDVRADVEGANAVRKESGHHIITQRSAVLNCDAAATLACRRVPESKRLR